MTGVRVVLDSNICVSALTFPGGSGDAAIGALLDGRYTALISESIFGDVLDDEPDNRVLECAVSGRADMIVTGDRAMLSLGTFKDIEVVSLRAFLGRLQVEP